ncbi:MAG: acetyl-CoA C-acyltransferase [Gammaproteobacteria bacterium]|nr:acetyl-CoA C-acyltransferase [Gammaproteobacteria bacterium]MCP5459613.1 acetyl-CoA C-acyltransferase [Gammaproteobacteria bacterium]
MSKQLQEAYVVAALRTPVGRSGRGMFRNTRPDDLLAHVIRGVVDKCPGLNPAEIEDVVIGCSLPEGEQGLDVARTAGLLAGLPIDVPGVTLNRFCSSGIQSIAFAADRIRAGSSDCIIAGGVESMSQVPMPGGRLAVNPKVFDNDVTYGLAFGMGITAEKVAEKWNVSREDQDAFGVESNRRALAAIKNGEFKDEILPYTIEERMVSPDGQTVQIKTRVVDTDEGPREATLEGVAKVRTAFDAKGSVTAANSSQTSDGAGAVMLMSERMVNKLGIKPLARFVSYAVTGCPPEIMGIGPLKAIPKALEMAGLKKEDLDWIELNEAFASQSLAIIRELGLDTSKVNPLGGAIALGHPLGATGAIRTATAIHGINRRNLRYGMVTMCMASGMGAAGIYERV